MEAPMHIAHSKHRKVWNGERRKVLIGLFFEELIYRLLGGKRPSQKGEFARADMIHWGLEALVEVKAVDNGHCPTVFVDQFERHLTNVGFPVSHLLYFICCYKVKVKVDGQSRSELAARTRTEGELEAFLAAHLTEVYVVHHTLLSKVLGEGDTARVRDREIIALSRHKLQAHSLDAATLKALNLRRSVIPINLRFRRQLLSFKLIMIAPRETVRRIKKTSKKRTIKRKEN